MDKLAWDPIAERGDGNFLLFDKVNLNSNFWEGDDCENGSESDSL